MNKILIIEDDPSILLGLSNLLKTEHFNVNCESNGTAGYDKALAENHDLILLDINLPGMNGFEVCRKLRENKYFQPIIMITSKSEQVDKIVGLEIGANDYIVKPFDNREVLARIRSNLRYNNQFHNNDSNSNQLERKLLALMFTDIVGYSKLMNENESSAFRLLQTHNAILQQSIIDHNGNVVEIVGDSFFASFNSVLDAVNCAVSIQNKLDLRNQNNHEKILIRIGLHLGDVIKIKNNLKGNAVNIASRIESVAEEGSIYISEDVYRAVNNLIKLSMVDLGKFKLKNIENKINLYKVIYKRGKYEVDINN